MVLPWRIKNTQIDLGLSGRPNKGFCVHCALVFFIIVVVSGFCATELWCFKDQVKYNLYASRLNALWHGHADHCILVVIYQQKSTYFLSSFAFLLVATLVVFHTTISKWMIGLIQCWEAIEIGITPPVAECWALLNKPSLCLALPSSVHLDVIRMDWIFLPTHGFLSTG